MRWEKRRISKAINHFIDQAKVRELQQHVEEEEAGAIKWGDKMVNFSKGESLSCCFQMIRKSYNFGYSKINREILPCIGHSALPARERAGDGVGDGEKEAS